MWRINYCDEYCRTVNRMESPLSIQIERRCRWMIVEKDFFGEGKYIEFKLQLPHKHENFLKDIIAFANTSGGKTIVGVEDATGDVVGIGEQNPFKLSDQISNMISDACIPLIHTDITPRTIDNKTVLEIEVFPGSQRPYYLKSVGKEKSSYIRVNGTSRPASERKLKELEMEGTKISYDMLPEIAIKYDEQAARVLCNRMYQTALNGCKTQEERDAVNMVTLEKLEDFGILCKDGHEYRFTHAYTLLTKPMDRFVKIQCAVFKGLVRDEFIDRKEFRGAIQEQLEMAYEFVLRHINMGAVIDGLYRRDVYELPVLSVREMIANAVLHRSYLDESSIQVSLYDDRLEIESPGMLYDGLTLTEAVAGKSRCRNKAIAEAFQYMKLIEGWGTGLPRLYQRCKEMGLQKPKFEEAGDGIRVTVYRSSPLGSHATQSSEHNSTSKENGSTIKETIKETAKEIIVKAIQANPAITMKELAERTLLTVAGVRYHLNKMRQAGTLSREGSTKAGKWIIHE